MTILWIKCESVLLIVALQTEEIDYKSNNNFTYILPSMLGPDDKDGGDLRNIGS
jgi:hypothetical protein